MGEDDFILKNCQFICTLTSTKMRVARWAGQLPGAEACFPHGLPGILGDAAEDKVCWLSGPCYVCCVLPGLVQYVLGCSLEELMAAAILLSVASPFSPSLGFTYFSSRGIGLALPLSQNHRIVGGWKGPLWVI